jgi:hypothetical protein
MEYMKRLILLTALLFALPSVSIAQDRTLYDINKEAIEITNHVIYYMNGDVQYTEEDLLTLKDAAQKNIRDLFSLMRERDSRRLIFTKEQAVQLKEKATETYNALIKVNDTDCNNLANDFLVWAYLIFLAGLVLTLSIGGAIYGIPIILFSLFVVFLGIVAFILCSLGFIV